VSYGPIQTSRREATRRVAFETPDTHPSVNEEPPVVELKHLTPLSRWSRRADTRKHKVLRLKHLTHLSVNWQTPVVELKHPTPLESAPSVTAGAAFLLHLTAGATPVEVKHLTPLESAGHQRPQSAGAAQEPPADAETPAELRHLSAGKQRSQQQDAVLLSHVSLNSSRASSSSCAPEAQACDAAASQVFFFFGSSSRAAHAQKPAAPLLLFLRPGRLA
jgi:hypothetical protein